MDFSIHICEYNRSNADYDIIYRPEGSGDYLFLLFKTPMRVYAGKQFSITQENACIFTHPVMSSIIRRYRNSATATCISGVMRIWERGTELCRT